MAIILALFFIGFQYDEKNAEQLKSSYKLINTNISQDQKFLKENLVSNSNTLIEEIYKSIDENKKLVILPETAFAFDLKNTSYEAILKKLSYKITIITGAFNIENDKVYNSTYIFKDGNFYILNKHFLVPFGEEIPFFKDLVQKYFLPGMEDLAKGPLRSEYKLNHQIITNAICYEVTKEQNYPNSKIIIALSNNAWFNHSSEYKLQQLLIKFYASKYGVSVYHAVNGKENAVILPKKLFYKKWELKFENFYQKIKNTL